jgi:hypothetical protein
MSIIRQVLAMAILTRMCASLALMLLDGASNLLEAATFAIALVGLAPVALVISGMGSSRRPVTAR